MKTLFLFMRHKMIGLISILLITPFFLISQPPTEDEILASIDLGTEWLADQQNTTDGSWNTTQRVAMTGFAITKLCDRAYEHFYDSPFDTDYKYSDTVVNGFDFLFSQARTHGTGTGIYMLEGTDHHYEIYNTSVGLMAIAASLTPGRVINYPSNTLVHGKTFLQLASDMVTYLAWSQNSNPSYGAYGGWGYEPGQYTRSDNSISGFAVLGLRYAEVLGATIPPAVTTKLNFWIDYIQNDGSGGSGYNTPTNYVNQMKTGNLLFESCFYGNPVGDARVQNALGYIGANWNLNDPHPGWRYSPLAMYCLMKGFESYNIDFINDGSGDVDWFIEFSTWLLDNQHDDGYWLAGNWGDQISNTCWALFILEKVVPNAPPVAVCQNISVFADGNCDGYAVATDFDNGSTDPEGEPLIYSVSPSAPYSLGVTTVTLTVTDIKDDSDQCTATITVVDNTPPIADVNPLPNIEGECSVNITAPAASDNCGGVLTGTTTDPMSYTVQGTYTVTWTYDDGNGNTLQQMQTVIVNDVTDPIITTIVSDLVMWPPNHKYETFVISDFVTAVSDNCATLVINDVYFKSVSSDELEDATGGGDGNTLEDMLIADDCMSIQLRKERQGGSNGRFYTVYLGLEDGNGNDTEAIVHVTVPTSIGNPAINDAAVFWVEGPCVNGKSAPFTMNNNVESGLYLANYPNPFNGTTTIAFTLNEPNDITLKVYNTLGIEVATLYTGFAEAEQKYTTDFNGNMLSEGMYIYVLQSKGRILGMNKMMLIK